MSESRFAGLAEESDRLAQGKVSARKLTELALDRIATFDSHIGAFRVVRAEAAMSEAAEADRRLAAGQRSPLLGVPIAIKDDMDLAGETTPFGCAGDHRPATEDSEITRRLREAGAIIVGKTKTSEFGQWPMGETTAFGAVRNPWDPDRTPGGSSSGSAAATAAGVIPAAVGSDGAGSVRIPAAWTGLVGVKPQRGRVPTWPHADPFYGLTVYGPLARTVADAALLLDVLTGEADAPYATAAGRDPGKLRIALSFRSPFGVSGKLDPEIRAAVTRMARVLTDLGHTVFPADPDYGLIGLSFLPRGTTGVTDWLDRTPNAVPEPRTRTEAFLGRHIGRRTLPLARRAEPGLRRRVGRIFDRADVVLTPTTARMPLRIGELDGLGWSKTGPRSAGACPFCWAWNVLGWPAVGVPAGLSFTGLPIGAQLLGRDHDEATLLALAAQLETVERWQDRHPTGVGAIAA